MGKCAPRDGRYQTLKLVIASNKISFTIYLVDTCNGTKVKIRCALNRNYSLPAMQLYCRQVPVLSAPAQPGGPAL